MTMIEELLKDPVLELVWTTPIELSWRAVVEDWQF